MVVFHCICFVGVTARLSGTDMPGAAEGYDGLSGLFSSTTIEVCGEMDHRWGSLCFSEASSPAGGCQSSG